MNGYKGLFPDYDVDHEDWIEYADKFSKSEIINFLKEEKIKTKLLKDVIDAHKMLIKQAKQRLSLSRNLEI